MTSLYVTGGSKYVEFTKGVVLVNGQILYVKDDWRIDDTELVGAPGGTGQGEGDYYIFIRPNRKVMESYYDKNWEYIMRSVASAGTAPAALPDEMCLGRIEKRLVSGATTLAAVPLNRGNKLIGEKDISDAAVPIGKLKTSNAPTNTYVLTADSTVTGGMKWAAGGGGGYSGGDLVMGTGDQVDFFDEIGDKIFLYSNTYGIGIESGSVTYWSGGAHTWRTGGTTASGGTIRGFINATNAQFNVPLSMNSSKITGLAAGTTAGDAVRYEQVIGVFANASHSHTSRSDLPSAIAYEDEANTFTANQAFTGNIDMNAGKITELGDATAATDALNMQTGDSRYVTGTAVTSAKPVFSAYRNATLTLTTDNVVVFDTEETDSEGYYNTSNGRFTPTRPGWYLLNTYVTKEFSGTSTWIVTIRKNGTAFKSMGVAKGESGVLIPRAGGSVLVYANGTDYFDVLISHNVGATTGILTGAQYTYFQATYQTPDRQGSTTTPKARVRRSTNMTGIGTTETYIIWDAEHYDDGNIWTSSPNATRLTAPVAGKYRYSCTISGTNGGGSHWVYVYKNGTMIDVTRNWAGGNTVSSRTNISGEIDMNGADYLEFSTSFDTAGGGGNLVIGGASGADTHATLSLIEDSVGGLIVPEDWHIVGAGGEPAFTNSWVSYGSPYIAASFRKDPFGRVTLRGAVRNGTVNSGIFTLPAGYRPPEQIRGMLNSNSAAAPWQVTNAGVVSMYSGGSNTFVDLDGISFDTT